MIRRKFLVIVIMALIFISSLIYVSFYTSKVVLKVSTTTSLENTGLLYALAEEFEKKNPNIIVQFISVGSGAALELAAKGDVDMVFVHAPPLEVKYIEQGVLINGTIFAYNYFVIVGPADDPAGVSGLDPIEAFKRIYMYGENGTVKFVSRGDNSGTNVRESYIWNKTGLDPRGKSWYIESGTGMGQTLLLANEKRAYTLSDIGTYLDFKLGGKIPDLELLVDQGDILLNIYSVYIVNPDLYPKTKYNTALRFLQFVVSEEGQNIIDNYKLDIYGVHLFYSAKGKEDTLRQAWIEFSS